MELGGADPARFRDLDHDVVGTAVLHLYVGVPLLAVPDAQGLVDVVARLRAGGGEALGDRLQAVDLEADVMDAAPALAPLHPRGLVVLELEDGEVEVAVAQVEPARIRAVDLRDLLHAEHVDVEAGRLVGVLGRQRDVLDLRHGRLRGDRGLRGRSLSSHRGSYHDDPGWRLPPSRVRAWGMLGLP